MAIIDIAYLRRQFDKRRLDDLTNDGDGPDPLIEQQAIDAAEGELFNTVSQQYSLAELEADEGIKRMVGVIALYNLELRRVNVTEAAHMAYERVMQALQRLRDGEDKLSAVPEVLPRVSPTSAADVFERSGLFDGLANLEDGSA